MSGEIRLPLECAAEVASDEPVTEGTLKSSLAILRSPLNSDVIVQPQAAWVWGA